MTEKIVRMDQALGGIARLTFQMSPGNVPPAKALHAIELLGTRVAPVVREAMAAK